MDLSNISWFVQTYSPATIEEVAKIEAELSLSLPDVYKYFLARSNGASANLAALYDTDSLIEMNCAYEVQEYAPGYVAIGNDNGGYHLLMKAEPSATEFRLVNDGDGVPSTTDCVDDFESWLHSADGNPHRNEL